MNRNVVIGVVLALLIVISAVQAVQLTLLKNKLGEAPKAGASTTVQTTATTTPTAAGNGPAAPAAAPAGVQNLPQMVGGC